MHRYNTKAIDWNAEDCPCGQDTRHIFHCIVCLQPITADNIGISTAEGSKHVIHSTQAEVDYHMDAPTFATEAEGIAYYLHGPRSHHLRIL